MKLLKITVKMPNKPWKKVKMKKLQNSYMKLSKDSMILLEKVDVIEKIFQEF